MWHNMLVLLADVLTAGRLAPQDDLSRTIAVHYMPGQQTLLMGRLEEARKLWEHALQQPAIPDFARRRLLCIMAVSYAVEGAHDRCLGVCSEAARLAAGAADEQALGWAVCIAVISLLRLQRHDEAARLYATVSEHTERAASRNMADSPAALCAEVHLHFLQGRYDKCVPALQRAVRALDYANVYEHLLCTNTVGTLVHQVWLRARQPDAPQALVQGLAELEQLSAAVLACLGRSAHPAHAPVLLPCMYRLQGMRYYLQDHKATALKAWSHACRYAREHELPFEEELTMQLQQSFGGGNIFIV